MVFAVLSQCRCGELQLARPFVKNSGFSSNRLALQRTMNFRLRAFGLHLLVSGCLLTLVLGTLYLGWYRWPGWYVAGASGLVAVLIAVDVALGPLSTFIVAGPTKPRPELVRDIAIIAAVQLCALIYGTVSLWNGRPLYYAFSENVLQLVQAYDIGSHEQSAARQQSSQLLPHWYSLPRWIWAPLPDDPKERMRIVTSAVTGGDDVIDMPRYFKPWGLGLPELRQQLKKVDDVGYFANAAKQSLKARMRAIGLQIDQANSIPLTGRGKPLLVVFDPAKLTMRAILAPAQEQRLEPEHYLVQTLRKLMPRKVTSHWAKPARAPLARNGVASISK